MSSDLDLLHGDRGTESCEYREAVLTTGRDQWGELYGKPLPLLHCPCGREMDIAHAYRCAYCGVWWCELCGKRHFAETEES
jgi:hypothetical protein